MRHQIISATGAGALLAATLFGANAGAQTMDTVGPHSAYCGSWTSGAWTPNGNCVDETTTTTTVTTQRTGAMPDAAGQMDRDRDQMADNDRPGREMQRVSGTITAVRGHLVTLQRSNSDLVIDDQPALDSESTGRVAVGRVVTAHGYWQDGTFYANRFDTAM
jgi:hypothetical protein